MLNSSHAVLGFARVSNIANLPLKCHSFQTGYRQAGEQNDAAFQNGKRFGESNTLFIFFRCRWIKHAPMGGNGLSRPNRTNFFGGVIANSNHKIENWSVRFGKLIPAFAACISQGNTFQSQTFKSGRVNLASWKTTGAESLKPAITIFYSINLQP